MAQNNKVCVSQLEIKICRYRLGHLKGTYKTNLKYNITILDTDIDVQKRR